MSTARENPLPSQPPKNSTQAVLRLWRAFQEEVQRNNELEERIDNLEERIQELEDE